MTRIMQTIDEARGRSVGVGATAYRDETLLHFDGHALIEDETFALPVVISEFLLVGGNSAVKLEDAVETFPLKKRGRLFAPDAASAIHQHSFLSQIL